MLIQKKGVTSELKYGFEGNSKLKIPILGISDYGAQGCSRKLICRFQPKESLSVESNMQKDKIYDHRLNN